VADALSRMPVNCAINYVNLEELFVFPKFLTVEEIAKATQSDLVLQKVCELTLFGWPSVNKDPSIEPYFTFRHFCFP